MTMQVPVKDRVTTIGEDGKRFWLYPARFTGDWLKKRRNVAYILILIYFLMPWLKIGGEQAILLDIAERKFAFFGMIFWPQDLLIFWFYLVGTVVAIFLITALWGRLWCGWACPQTVFLEHVFRRIEIMIEGDATHRRKLDASPMSWEKFRKKSLKYFIFLIISSHFANTALCYFVGTDQVLHMTFTDPNANWGWFTFMAFFNFLFFIDFAWFREQFCIIACPYGRFQSVLLDSESMIVGYDSGRGEPRGVLRKNQDRQEGDCIDCKRCVAVCPTGIDIRMGLQMECINCTACMDACDEIMVKVNKPKKLIGYTSLAQLEGRKRQAIRPRVLVYIALFVTLWSVGSFMLTHKKDIILRMVRPPGNSFTVTEDPPVISNLFQARITNKTNNELVLTARVPEGFQVVVALNPWRIPPQETAVNQVFIRKSGEHFSQTGNEKLNIGFYHEDQLIIQHEVTIVGPKK